MNRRQPDRFSGATAAPVGFAARISCSCVADPSDLQMV